MQSYGPKVDTAAHPFGRTPLWLWAVLIAAAAGWLGFTGVTDYLAVRRQRIADARAFTVEGPACPRITTAQFLRPHRKGLRRFEFGGASYFRRYGHVSCAAIRDKGGLGNRLHPVCQFTSPGDLMVRTERGEWYFGDMPGSPATVSVQAGAPTCVMASTFSLRPSP